MERGIKELMSARERILLHKVEAIETVLTGLVSLNEHSITGNDIRKALKENGIIDY